MRTAVLAALLLLAAPAVADVVAWPTGAPPCDDPSDLEGCLLTGIDPGDVVEIEADALPAQSVSVSPGKSFTLRPADGFAPTFEGFTSIFVAGGDADVTVLLEGLTLQHGEISARQTGSGTFDVTIRENDIRQITSSGDAICVESTNSTPPYGPTLFTIERNDIGIDVEPSDAVSAICVGGFQANGNAGVIRGNVINQVGGGQEDAIAIGNGNVTLDVDVIGNEVTGSDFNGGVGIFQFGDSGATTARIVNNAISGQVDTSGLPGGISLSVSGGSGVFAVLNNTVAFNESGVSVGGRPDLGATATFLFANNLVAFNDEAGFAITDFSATSTNEFNLVFGNGFDDFTPGPGTVTMDPLFVSEDGFSLQLASPARNAGTNARVPMDVTTDLPGGPRIEEGTVDVGAVEVPGPGAAAGAATALLTLAGLRRHRRREGSWRRWTG